MKKMIIFLVCLLVIIIFSFNFLLKDTESDFRDKVPEGYEKILEDFS